MTRACARVALVATLLAPPAAAAPEWGVGF